MYILFLNSKYVVIFSHLISTSCWLFAPKRINFDLSVCYYALFYEEPFCKEPTCRWSKSFKNLLSSNKDKTSKELFHFEHFCRCKNSRIRKPVLFISKIHINCIIVCYACVSNVSLKTFQLFSCVYKSHGTWNPGT